MMAFKIKYCKHILNHVVPKNVKQKNYSDKLCEDYFIGTIEFDKTNNCWIDSISKTNQLTRNNKKIDYSNDINDCYLIILLESPHVDEYDKTLITPLPANGTTGKNIILMLCDVLNNKHNVSNAVKVCGEHSKYTIALIEPVNYQASEGISPRKYPEIRDSNWLYYFNNGFDKLLKNKIKYFINNNQAEKTIVINLCSNSTKAKLQNQVTKTLRQMDSDLIQIYIGQHPSTWKQKNVRPCLK